MRGWKQGRAEGQNVLQRALNSPDDEGMETCSQGPDQGLRQGALNSPDDEGMETARFRPAETSRLLARSTAPMMRGWKLAPSAHRRRAEYARSTAPMMRGWKPIRAQRALSSACPARSTAPMMRGWKHGTGERTARFRPGALNSPDDEGMETTPYFCSNAWMWARSTAPMMRGWKPDPDRQSPDHQSHARSTAPMMRGWKLGTRGRPPRSDSSALNSPDDEGMETVHGSHLLCDSRARAQQPR